MTIDILDAIYDHADNMTIDNDYSFDWKTLRSIGNGSLATKKGDAVFSVKFLEAEVSEISGQSEFLFTTPTIITGSVAFSKVVNLEESDYELVKTKALIFADLTRAFGFQPSGMCSAGSHSFELIRELPADPSGNVAIVKLEYQQKYYGSRK